jgi:signal peptidase I
VTVLAVVLAAVCALAALRALLVIVTVNGASMEPTYRPGEHLLVVRRPLARARAGSAVVFRLPESMRRGGPGRNPLLIKRIAAVGGQPVPVSVREAVGAREGDVVPNGQVVLLADAAGGSGDSRSWGYLPAGIISGVIVGRLSRAEQRNPEG